VYQFHARSDDSAGQDEWLERVRQMGFSAEQTLKTKPNINAEQDHVIIQ